MDPLLTERLRIRRFTVEDTDVILHLVNDPSWLHYIGDKQVRTTTDAERYLLEGPIQSYQRHEFGLYCVESLEDGAAIGMCGLIRRAGLADVDIGFAVLPTHRARGCITEAARAVMAHAQRDLHLKRLCGITRPDNLASISVLIKLGMYLQGRVILAEGAEPLLLYAVDLDPG